MTEDNKQGEQQVKKQEAPIIITECPTDPCAIFYTDTLSQSLLIVCKSKKHIDMDMEKQVSGVNGSQPNSDANLLTDTPSHDSPTQPVTTKER